MSLREQNVSDGRTQLVWGCPKKNGYYDRHNF